MALIKALQPSKNIFLEIAKGNITGHEILRKFGKNVDIDTAAEEMIWDGGGDITFPLVAATVSIASSSAQDSATGTGLAKIKIIGLSEGFIYQEEEIALNGLTPVVSTLLYRRFFRAYAYAASGSALGSGAAFGSSNAGIITITGATLLGQINTGNGQTLMAVYTVPVGKQLIIYNLEGGVLNGGGTGAKAGEIHLHSIDCVNQAKRLLGTLAVQNTGGASYLSGSSTIPHEVLPEKTDVFCEGFATNNNTDMFAEFSGILTDTALDD